MKSRPKQQVKNVNTRRILSHMIEIRQSNLYINKKLLLIIH